MIISGTNPLNAPQVASSSRPNCAAPATNLDGFAGTQKPSFRSCPVTGHKPSEDMKPSTQAGKGVCPFAGMKPPGQS